MKASITGWTIALAAATIALPVSAFAQTTSQTQPPAAQTAPEQAQPPSNAPAQDAAKVHLTAARNTLSELTQLPAAAQLQGETRAQVSQLINNFNELITTQANWRAAYSKVEANLEPLLGAAAAEDPARASGTAGAVGTSGTVTLDPAIRTKLVEFRKHLDLFEQAAEAASEPASPAAAAPPSDATAAPPSTPAEDPTPDPATEAINTEELLQHIEAIEAILNAQSAAQTAAQSAAGGVATANPAGSPRTAVSSADVTLNQSQMEELRTHLQELRRLLEKK